MCDLDCNSDCDCDGYWPPEQTKKYGSNDKLNRKIKMCKEDNEVLKEYNEELKEKVIKLKLQVDGLRSKLETAEGNFRDVMAMMKEAAIDGSKLGLDTKVNESDMEIETK